MDASILAKAPAPAVISQRYTLLGADGRLHESHTAGVLGGNRRGRIYGRLDCPSALGALAQGDRYGRYRVFFSSEHDAVSAGYRPCARCLPHRYLAWKRTADLVEESVQGLGA